MYNYGIFYSRQTLKNGGIMKGISAFDLRCQEYDKPLKWLKFNLYVRFPLGIIATIIGIIRFISDLVYLNSYTIDYETINLCIYSIIICCISIVLSIIIMIGMFKLKYWAINLWFISLIISMIDVLIVCSLNENIYNNTSAVISVLIFDLPTIVYLYKRRDFVNKKEEKITDIPQESSTQEFLNEDEINEKQIKIIENMPAFKINTHIEETQKEKKKIFCKKCGSEINRKTKKCTGCGKQYIKITLIQIIISIFIILFIISFFIVVLYQNHRITVLNEDIEKLNNTIEDKNTSIKELNKKIKEQEETISDKFIDTLKADFLDKKIALICDDTNYYHTFDCEYFRNCDSYRAYNIEAAKVQGYIRHKCWNN